jgi:glycyl-tRNA synthetase beta chain
MPRFAGDQLPTTTTGAIIALADRLDTISGIFGIGQQPTGSKDPFALRRASIAVLRILVEKNLALDLRDLLTFAKNQHKNLTVGDELVEQVLAYMLERFRAFFEDANIPAEVFQSVTAKQLSQPLDINQRVLAVNEFSKLPQAQALAAANKRVSNILAKQNAAVCTDVNAALLQEDAEKNLAQAVSAKAAVVAPLFAAREYTKALAALADLQPTVDAFFDSVMVMSDDPALQQNRLALLQQLRGLFLEVADISYLVPAKN